MKRFRFRQDVSVTEEDGTPVKEFSVDMCISTEVISDDSVKDMFELYSNGFTGLLEEASFVKDKEEEIDFISDDIRKGW